MAEIHKGKLGAEHDSPIRKDALSLFDSDFHQTHLDIAPKCDNVRIRAG